jgi:hypothetical protein
MSADRGWFGLPKIDPEEKEQALQDPGTPWSAWLSSSFAKTYLGLGFVIADGILLASWLGPPPEWGAAVGSLALAVYGEYVLWQYLWYVPRAFVEAPTRFRVRPGKLGPVSEPARHDGSAWVTMAHRCVHPFPFGRWTEAAERHRKGLAPVPLEGPDPREFL